MKKQNKAPTQRSNVRTMVLASLFTAIILIMAFTPLGLIDLPLIKATILHVPVIIGGILLGPKAGAFFGLIFALTSLFKNTTAPALLSFAFSPLIPVPGAGRGSLWALVICFVPRILTGVVPWFVFRGLARLMGRFQKEGASRTVALTVAGALGAVVNTALVMGLIGTLLQDGFASAKGIPVNGVSGAIMAIVLANGVPETIAAAVLTPAVCLPLMKVFQVGVPPIREDKAAKKQASRKESAAPAKEMPQPQQEGTVLAAQEQPQQNGDAFAAGAAE